MMGIIHTLHAAIFSRKRFQLINYCCLIDYLHVSRHFALNEMSQSDNGEKFNSMQKIAFGDAFGNTHINIGENHCYFHLSMHVSVRVWEKRYSD